MDDHSTQFSIALWDYALILYARPGVAAACLALQDEHGADVCELLWLCWMDRLGLTTNANAATVLAPIRDQQDILTRLLRERRRELRAHATPGTPLAQWRETIKNAELAAERGTLLQLQALARRGQGVRPLHQDDAALITRLIHHVGRPPSAVSDPLSILVGNTTIRPNDDSTTAPKP
ncbi:TIGR02444 family protein [Halomonas sp. M20]|uniref:TIGR02444 family protein n=1 Tax=Halomonas sp. M20 TaxID=2763264 RepID=UPI001D0AD895|nr:TIGR02444 family protein [Halomonas sp. M20]